MSPRAEKARERAAQEKKERMELALKELEKIRTARSGEKKEARVSMTDPEARIMKQSSGGYAPAYNVQISTDAACAIIVGAGVSQRPEDSKELLPAIERVEENTGKKPTQVVADGGFTSRENILAMEAKGVDYIGSPDGSNQSEARWKHRGVDPAFRTEHFSYDEHNNTYVHLPGREDLAAEREGSDARENQVPLQGHRAGLFLMSPQGEVLSQGEKTLSYPVR